MHNELTWKGPFGPFSRLHGSVWLIHSGLCVCVCVCVKYHIRIPSGPHSLSLDEKYFPRWKHWKWKYPMLSSVKGILTHHVWHQNNGVPCPLKHMPSSRLTGSNNMHVNGCGRAEQGKAGGGLESLPMRPLS